MADVASAVADVRDILLADLGGADLSAALDRLLPDAPDVVVPSGQFSSAI
jgi:hypothetical protein